MQPNARCSRKRCDIYECYSARARRHIQGRNLSWHLKWVAPRWIAHPNGDRFPFC